MKPKKSEKKVNENVSHETIMTAKQRRFVEEYMVDLNATQAAIRAGYSENTARHIGSENLSKPVIKKAIEERLKARGDVTDNLRERVLKEMGRIAFFDARKTMNEDGSLKPIHELDDDTAAAIAGMEIDVETSRARKINSDGEDEGDTIQTDITRTHKIKIADKQGALSSLARHLGLFDKDKVKLVGSKDEPVQVKIDAGTELADIMTLEQLEEVRRRVIDKSNAG